MEEKDIEFQHDTDAIKIKRTLIQFTTPVYESSKELLSSVAFDESSINPNVFNVYLQIWNFVINLVTLIKLISN